MASSAINRGFIFRFAHRTGPVASFAPKTILRGRSQLPICRVTGDVGTMSVGSSFLPVALLLQPVAATIRDQK
jgi:hypothetical protein